LFAIWRTRGRTSLQPLLFERVTGQNITRKDVLCIGERIVNLEKAYNVREGWTRKDDNLPDGS